MRFNKKYIFLFIIFVAYILLNVLIEPDLLYNYDYLIPWYAALYVIRGIPLYEQPEFKIIDGQTIAFPYHLPIYIYFLAALIYLFGESYIAGKIGLIIFTFCDALLFEHLIHKKLNSETKKKKIWEYFSIILLLNPLVIIFTFAGQFDSLAILFFLISYYFYDKIEGEANVKNISYSILSAISLGFGFLTKIIPLLLAPIIFLGLLFRKKYTETVVFFVTFLSFTGGMLVYLFIKYPFIKYLGFGWQIERGANSMSLYYYLFDLPFNIDAIIVGVGMLLLTSFFIYELMKKRHIDSFIYKGIFLVSFFILYRVFYPHYLLWLIPYLTLILLKFIENRKKRQIIIFSLVVCLELIMIVLWYGSFFNIIPLSLGVLIVISAVNLLCLVYYCHLFFRFRFYNQIQNSKEQVLEESL